MSAPPLDAWAWPGEPHVDRAPDGLINDTFVVRVHGEPVAVVQRLNPRVFDPAVHHNIEAVTAHLERKGLPTPRLVRTAAGGLWHTDAHGAAWRQLTWIGDRTVDKLVDPADARSAGALLARFHAALRDLDHTFVGIRLGVHDTDAHIARLRASLDTGRSHRLYEAVAPLAERILARWDRWDGPRDLPKRVIHADPKISNVRFAGPHALALIDLDTVARGTLDEELGDAFRSWCNPAREDDASPRFDLALFAAGVEGYVRDAVGVAEVEWASVVPGVLRITNELAARFARDALAEEYFGWDPTRFASRGHHNLARASNQEALAASVERSRTAADAVLHQARSRRGDQSGGARR